MVTLAKKFNKPSRQPLANAGKDIPLIDREE